MAYVKEEEETDQTGVEEFAPQAPAPMGGAPAPVEGAAPTPAPQAPAASGTATNLQEYMKQNIPAAQQMAGQVTRQTETQAQQIGQQVQEQQSEFMKKVAENRARLQQAGAQAQQQIEQAGQQEFLPQDLSTTQQLVGKMDYG